MSDALLELNAYCEKEGISFVKARAFVNDLIEGASPDLAVSIFIKLREPKGGSVSTEPASLEEMLAGLDERRNKIAKRLEAIVKEKAELKQEEKKLNQAANALRKITGAENKEFYCDACELPFASRQGLSTHRTRVHKPKAVASA